MGRGPTFRGLALLPLAAAVLLIVPALPPSLIGSPMGLHPPPKQGAMVDDLGPSLVAAARASILSGNGPGATASVSGRWTPLVPALATPPLTQMVYDAADGYLLVLGGFLGHDPSLPTWIFSHGNWTELRSPGPPGDIYSSITYDAADREVVLFGGFANPNLHVVGTNDTWVYHAGNWTLLPSSVTHAPSNRFQASMAYDGFDGYVLLWGGRNGTCSPSLVCKFTDHLDTWKFRGGQWTRLIGPGGLHPGSNPGGLMAYDAALGRVVLVGGIYWGGRSPGVTITWTFASGKWSPLNITPPRGISHGRLNSNFGVCMAYDAQLGKLVLFRGWTNAVTPGPTQTFVFNGTWHVVKVTTAPPAGIYDNCAYDPAIGKVVTFGNPLWAYLRSTWSAISAPRAVPPVDPLSLLTYDAADGCVLYFGAGNTETWEYSHQQWTDVTGNSRARPPVAPGPALTYDGADRYVLLFLGSPNETWSFHAGNWTNRTVPGAPSPRQNPALAYDSTDGYVVLFGGAACRFGQCRYEHDTWRFLGGNWSVVLPAKGVSPPGRNLAAFVGDAADGYLVLFGGTQCTSTQNSCRSLNDTWSYRGGSWSNHTSGASPAARSGPLVTYDLHIGQVMLFGGCPGTALGTPVTAFADTWVYTAGQWSPVLGFPTAPPPGRCHAALAYDPQTGRDLLTSGDGVRDLWSLRLT